MFTISKIKKLLILLYKITCLSVSGVNLSAYPCVRSNAWNAKTGKIK